MTRFHAAFLDARYNLTETFQMEPFQMMRYSHCKNRYGDVVVRARGNLVVAWCQHVNPEDPDKILVTWYYGMTNKWLASFVVMRSKIQLRTMLRKLRKHLGNMKFHSGRVSHLSIQIWMSQPDGCSQKMWNIWKVLVRRMTCMCGAWTRHDGSNMWYNIPPKCFK